MSTPQQEFEAAFDKFLDEVSVADALSVATGIFVGLILGLAEQQGHDPNLGITIDGGISRDITIHPCKKGKNK